MYLCFFASRPFPLGTAREENVKTLQDIQLVNTSYFTSHPEPLQLAEGGKVGVAKSQKSHNACDLEGVESEGG